MAKTDQRMQMIGSAITLQAEQERRAIIDEANARRERELAAYKEEIVSGWFVKLQPQARLIRQQAVRDKARASQEARRTLLRRREELAAQVFAAVRSRLLEYAATREYRAALLEDLGAAQTQYDHTTTTILLREEDLPLAPEIQKLLPGCRVEASRRLRLGGFQLRNEADGILLDKTLDSALAGQRSWFLTTCGMRIDGGGRQ